MWRVSVRDLLWRRRRFAIALLATGLVFSMTLLMSGISSSLHAQNRRIVRSFSADAWVVAKGTAGPFTASSAIPAAVSDAVAKLPGVRRADPIIVFRSTVGPGTLRDVNVLGYRPGGIGAPHVTSGRGLRAPDEVVADTTLGYRVGERVKLGGHPLRVVGLADAVTFYFGTPTLVLSIADVQRLAFAGQALASAIVTRGVPRAAASGLHVLTDDQVVHDLERPMKNSDQTLSLVNALLWIVAAGIIGSIVYLSALERGHDFAVLKATGATNRSLLTGLALQAVVLATAAALLAAVLAAFLAPIFPFTVSIPGGAYVSLVAVALAVGLLSSLAGLRRAVRVDPALAFGGA